MGRRRGVSDDLEKEWELWNIPEEERRRMRAEKTGGPLVIHRDNWPVVRLFMACQSQWIWAPAGAATAGGAVIESMRMGLNYAGVRAAAAMARIRIKPEMFHALQIMEAEALKADGQRQ